MIKPKKRPRTQSFPRELWPQRDQDALDKAFALTRLKKANGKFRAPPKPKHQHNVTYALEQLWAYQNAMGIPADTPLVERVGMVNTIEALFRVKADEEKTRSKIGKPRTPLDFLERINSARDRLLFGQSDPLFKEWVSRERYALRGLGRRKTAPLEVGEVYQLALTNLHDLMARILETDADLEVYSDFQTALMTGTLAIHPGRSQDLMAMLLGDHVEGGGTYVLLVEAQKNRGPATLIRSITDELAHFFTFFLETVRPELERNHKPQEKLWLAEDGDPLPQMWFARRFKAMIKASTGVHMTPHQLRHTAATVAHEAEFSNRAMAAVLTESDFRRPVRTYSSHEPQYATASVELMDQLMKINAGS